MQDLFLDYKKVVKVTIILVMFYDFLILLKYFLFDVNIDGSNLIGS